MRTEKLITVVTPTIAGREALLEECRASVAAQTLPCEHSIILDSGLAGPGFARNLALKFVTTPLVGFLDDDDLADPDWAMALVSSILRYNSDLAWSRWRYDGYDFGHPQPAEGEVATLEEIRAANRIPMTWVAKTQAVVNAGGFPNWPRDEDHGLLVRMLEQHRHFVATGEELWTYRPQAGGRTLSGTR